MISYSVTLCKTKSKTDKTYAVIHTGFDSENDIDELLSNKILAAIEQCQSPSDLTRTFTLPPPDDGMRWSENKELPKRGQKYFSYAENEVERALADFFETKLYVQIPIEPQKRAYDWSRTGQDVLVEIKHESMGFFPLKGMQPNLNLTIAEVWQAHTGYKCPVDDGCIVSVRYQDGEMDSGRNPSIINWEYVTAWKFERLADNVVWSMGDGK